jgi:PAS domain S-box-containing protein
VKLRRKDGQLFDAFLATFVVGDRANQPIGRGIIINDISERKRAEAGRNRALAQALQSQQALQESQDRFRTIVEMAPSALMITDAEGNNTYVSPNCEQIFGYTREELQGQFRWWVHPDDTPRAREAFDRTFRQGIGERNFEYKAVKKDGTTWFASSSWEPLRDSTGQLIGAVLQTIDVSERKRTEEEKQRHAEALTALHETSLDLAMQRALPDLLQAIVVRAVELLEAQGGGFYLYRPETDTMELVYTHGLAPDFTGIVLRRGEGLCGKVLESGQPLVVEDYHQWAGRSEQFTGAAFPSNVAVPILWVDRPLGVLYLADDPPRVFSAADVSLLERFAPLGGAALENARLLDAERTRRNIAETLREASAVLNSTLELETVLDLILQQIEQVVPYDTASVQRLHEKELEIVACRGFENPGEVLGLRFPLTTKFPNLGVIENKASSAIEDVTLTYPHFDGEADTYSSGHIRSWLGVPLIVKDQVIGMIALDRAVVQPYTGEEASLALAFANQAAAAIENARLYRDVQQQMEHVRRAQAQLVQSAKLAAIGELAAGVAHELNNPLTAVLGFAELLRENKELDTRFLNDVESIVTEARRARQIVRSLLDFSRQTAPEKRPIDLNKVLRQTLAVIREYLERSGVEIVEEYSLEIGRPLLDEGQMRQVFLNLITNAAQAMPGGGRLRVQTARVDDHIIVSITDSGVGIAPHVQERIFEPFFTTNPSGTGLGLSVSLGFVQGHGGKITVESAENRGSTFTVWLPEQTDTSSSTGPWLGETGTPI